MPGRALRLPGPRAVRADAGQAARSGAAAGLMAVLGGLGPAAAQAPLSAIDWLRETLDQPTGAVLPLSPPAEPAAAAPGGTGAIVTRALDSVAIESAGLYPAGRVGLPRDIWGPSTGAEIAALIAMLPGDTLPALRDLTFRLLLAEFAPPQPGPGDPAAAAEAFLAARVDALVAMGALDQAGALLAAVEPDSAGLVHRRFELRLLLGEDEGACADLARAEARRPGLTTAAEAPDALRAGALFCRARAGDWIGVERSLAEARAGGAPLRADYAALLERFIDIDEHAEPVGDGADAVRDDAGGGASPDTGGFGPVDPPVPAVPPAPVVPAGLRPPLPERPSPLTWRLLEALGEPVATQSLPLAFAHADLRGTAGWRAQIEAAERLVRAGALAPNQLLGLYTARRPAASGGIWERVRRVQTLDAALALGAADAIGPALAAAWPQLQDAELEVAAAELFGRALMAAPLTGAARQQALSVALLSADYELAALAIDPATAPPRLRRLAAVARGLPPDDPALTGADAEAAVLAVFSAPDDPPEAVAARLAEGRIGEELLRQLVRMGASGDPRMLSEGLGVLRHLGLEDIARRAALQALMLERRG